MNAENAERDFSLRSLRSLRLNSSLLTSGAGEEGFEFLDGDDDFAARDRGKPSVLNLAAFAKLDDASGAEMGAAGKFAHADFAYKSEFPHLDNPIAVGLPDAGDRRLEIGRRGGCGGWHVVGEVCWCSRRRQGYGGRAVFSV